MEITLLETIINLLEWIIAIQIGFYVVMILKK